MNQENHKTNILLKIIEQQDLLILLLEDSSSAYCIEEIYNIKTYIKLLQDLYKNGLPQNRPHRRRERRTIDPMGQK